MYPVLVLAAGILGVVLYLALRRFRTTRARARAARAAAAATPGPRPGTASAAERPTDLPTFNVVALGTRGSGKTMLLASMYHELQTMSGRGYYLTAPYEQVLLLNQCFCEAADTEQEWPAGTTTAAMRSFEFTVRTRGDLGRPVPVLGLDYLEYAGGLLTDPQAPGSTAQEELLTHIRSAQALIGIVDGYWLRRMIDNDPVARQRMQQAMTSMIGLMMSAECPITFVITKWDLLQDIESDEEARLHFARKHLLHNRGFRDLVSVHASRRTVRLVPVSAVGPDFAVLSDEGVVTKRPDGQLQPHNADAPLAAVVPDAWEQVEQSVNQQELRSAIERLGSSTATGRRRAVADLTRVLGSAASRVLGIITPPAGLVLDLAMGLSREPDVEQRISDVMAQDRALTEGERQFEENRSARRRVLRELQSRVDVLEGRLPSSRFTGEA